MKKSVYFLEIFGYIYINKFKKLKNKNKDYKNY